MLMIRMLMMRMSMGGSDMMLHTSLKQQHCLFNLAGEASLDFTEFFGGIDYGAKIIIAVSTSSYGFCL